MYTIDHRAVVGTTRAVRKFKTFMHFALASGVNRLEQLISKMGGAIGVKQVPSGKICSKWPIWPN
jgi:hypothetical protein